MRPSLDSFIEDDGFFNTGCSQCNWVEGYGHKWLRCREDSYFSEFCEEHARFFDFMEDKRVLVEISGHSMSNYPFSWPNDEWQKEEPVRWKDTFQYLYRDSTFRAYHKQNWS